MWNLRRRYGWGRVVDINVRFTMYGKQEYRYVSSLQRKRLRKHDKKDLRPVGEDDIAHTLNVQK